MWWVTGYITVMWTAALNLVLMPTALQEKISDDVLLFMNVYGINLLFGEIK